MGLFETIWFTLLIFLLGCLVGSIVQYCNLDAELTKKEEECKKRIKYWQDLCALTVAKNEEVCNEKIEKFGEAIMDQLKKRNIIIYEDGPFNCLECKHYNIGVDYCFEHLGVMMNSVAENACCPNFVKKEKL